MSFRLIVFSVAFLMSMPLYATWQLANPYQSTVLQQSVAPDVGDTSYPTRYVSSAQCSVEVKKGFLKENVLRIAGQYHWKVQWLASPVYRVLINTTIGGSSFELMMAQLMDNYPLRVSYDDVDRIMVVQGK